VTEPEDAVEAALALLASAKREVRAAIPGHVPGTYAWYVAARLGLKLLDAAANGRGHPTVKLGGMGLASKPDVLLHQACVNRHAGVQVVARGNLVATSNIMRAAAVQCGGLVMAVRGPFAASFVREHGARGAIGFQLELGHAMLAAKGNGRVATAAAHLHGRVLCEGEVLGNDVAYREGFDVGRVLVKDGARQLALGVFNEFMTAERDGERLAAFPDLIASLDPASGEPVAISELVPGTRVAVMVAPSARIPLGAGVFDPAAYVEIESALGTNLFKEAER
jgi:DUF917 family protein